MKHFIYKTTHKTGKYYIGRHSTDNIDDGYMGSGKWPRSVKDRSTLTREILEYVDDVETLKQLEGRYLAEHYGSIGCMNRTPDPVGFASGEDNPMQRPEVADKVSGDNHWLRKSPERRKNISNLQEKKYANGQHNWSNDHPNRDGSISRRTSEIGHNIFQTNNPSKWRSEQNIHHWQHGNAPNANGKLNKKLVEEGRHNFLGPELNNKRIADGTHNFVGSDGNARRLAEGRHPSQMKKTCEHCGKSVSVGMYTRWHGDKCKENHE